MSATGFAAPRLDLFPRWFGFLGLLGGLFFLLVLGLLEEDLVNGMFEVFYPFLSLFIFAIGSSVSFLKRLGRGDSPAIQDG